jgi:hypothetical protein
MTPLAALLSLLPAVLLQEWPRPEQRIACGPLTLEVYVSRTAHVFHVVDQLAAWDDSCHGQYREHMELSPEDEAELARYAEVRGKRRWGQGLEQTFYVPHDLEDAARAGERAKQVTRWELDVILPVLRRFAPRAEELLDSKRTVLEHAFEGVDRARLTEAAEKLARFTGTKKLTVPVFPLASPAPGGGGMDGGRLRWELYDGNVSSSVLLHELTHAFFAQREAELRTVVEATPGLSLTLLGEGFAYAMAPGLYPDGDGDNLRYNVAKDRENHQAWEDDGPGRYRTYALGLRPLLAQALEEQATLESFLPRARDVFLALREVEEATVAAIGPPKLAIAGPAGDVVRERLLDSKYHLWINWFNHAEGSYREVLPELHAGDLFVLLVVAGDERIPEAFASLSPVPQQEIERHLASGKTIEEERVEPAGYRVVLLAAPTRDELQELARATRLLDASSR